MIFAYGTITLFGRLFQNRSTNQILSLYTFLRITAKRLFLSTPRPNFLAKEYWRGLDSSLFARRYWGNMNHNFIGVPDLPRRWRGEYGLTNKKVNRFFLFLRVLKCFTSPGSLFLLLRKKI